MKLFYYILFSVHIFMIGCQTSMYQQFEQVNVGMDKDDVLQIMGSPQRTQRWRGKDRWTFVFYEDRIRFEKEVQFHEGIATYVGYIWQPPKEESAEYIDQKNKERSEYLDKIAYAIPAQSNTQIEKSSAVNHSEKNSLANDNGLIYTPTFESVESGQPVNTTSGSR